MYRININNNEYQVLHLCPTPVLPVPVRSTRTFHALRSTLPRTLPPCLPAMPRRHAPHVVPRLVSAKTPLCAAEQRTRGCVAYVALAGAPGHSVHSICHGVGDVSV